MNERKAPGTRKPYRISKPREKWTDTEHERFVNAVNQYGRNWRKIVQKVGTRSVAQVRSHAQKYFLKLEKAGNTEEVPPARAKRPSSKPYPMKAATAEDSAGGTAATAPESDESGAQRLRRTGRHSTRPNRQDFTFLEESPGPFEMEEGEQNPSEEGNGSNQNNSGSDGKGSSQRQSSVLSCAELQDNNGLPSASGAGLLSDSTVVPREMSDPADASSIPPESQGMDGSMGDPSQYEELYNLAGRLCGNQDSSNRHMVSQLGNFQREKLVHMLDCLKNDVKAGMGSPHGPTPPPLHSSASHIGLPLDQSTATPTHFDPLVHSHGLGATAGSLTPVNGHLGSPMHLDSGLSGQGSFSSNFGSMDPAGSMPGVSRGDLGEDLLHLPSSSGMDAGGWGTQGMSGDLSHLLSNPDPYIGYEAPGRADSRIDSKIFDY